jgi:hypothetical protein
MASLFVLVLFVAVQATVGQQHRYPYDDDGGDDDRRDFYDQQAKNCPSCNVEMCQKPIDCVAGVVKDSCGCCDVCGKAEYELCDHPKVQSPYRYGNCGPALECRVRKDLEHLNGGPEAICYCRTEGSLCGTDNVTYDSPCQLEAAKIVKNMYIGVGRDGPCNSAPLIISPPESVRNVTGSEVALMCESKGFPIPTIEWTFTRVDSQTIFLPSDDLHISVNMRGGPEKWQVTGWMQIVGLEKIHEGDYTCVAQNEFGVTKATARVNVINDNARDL